MKKIYNSEFYEGESESALSAAQIIFPYVIGRIGCKSIIDFGCGTGEWLKVAKELGGITKVLGLDGIYVKEYLKISPNEFYACDLTENIDLDTKFDLAITLEAAEHLPGKSAKTFVQNLIRHSDIILFSAAVPYQGGTKHMNEQYPSYWRDIFSEFNFIMCDCLRARFWNDKRIDIFYRQNMFIYCKENIRQEIEKKFMVQKLVDIIHPSFWEKVNLHSYIFPFEKVEHNKKVIIYGAGTVGKAYINQLTATKYAEIVLWCDSSFRDYEWLDWEITNPEEIMNCQYDYIVIAIKNKKVAMEILNTLVKMGIAKDKMIWRSPEYTNRF